MSVSFQQSFTWTTENEKPVQRSAMDVMTENLLLPADNGDFVLLRFLSFVEILYAKRLVVAMTERLHDSIGR
ncbi:unnamed protein product [Fusarium venenatum]|uniref:Uncharacterized protein n=1 Tax=Fusarium venenatum TaxID=56646 RepID=A0A2L2T4G7_9HYPO|nr:uncharacterized protein FVRRES_02186 [Fusarium venenatum]CEI65674.1 unnamed protein product [Fusarium venenatum]